MMNNNRQLRRMMNKMGLDMNEINNVQEVIIKTNKKEIIIQKPSVTEMKSQSNSIFQIIANDFEEIELEKPVFEQDDVMLVCQQSNVNKDQAIAALTESKGDLAKAILLLTTK